jgi:hypothetical protein
MVTQGALPGDYFGKPGGFVVMSREDMLEQTIVPPTDCRGGRYVAGVRSPVLRWLV